MTGTATLAHSPSGARNAKSHTCARSWPHASARAHGSGTRARSPRPSANAGARARAQLHVSVILSVIAATSLRAFEVLLAAMFPGMPRYAIVRQLVRFASGAPRGSRALHVGQADTQSAN